jgi:hypothetical protein
MFNTGMSRRRDAELHENIEGNYPYPSRNIFAMCQALAER